MRFSDFLANLRKPPIVRLNIGPNATVEERLENAAALVRMNPKGFRSLPTSRKNLKFHSKKPTTMLEKLAAQTSR